MRNELRLAIRRARRHAEKSLDLAEKHLMEREMTIAEMKRKGVYLTYSKFPGMFNENWPILFFDPCSCLGLPWR